MPTICNFASGSEIVLHDGKMYLLYGKRVSGRFMILFSDLCKHLSLKLSKFDATIFEEVRICNDKLTVKRIKDYDGDVLMDVDKMDERQKIGNIYEVEFDIFESYIIISIVRALAKERGKVEFWL